MKKKLLSFNRIIILGVFVFLTLNNSVWAIELPAINKSKIRLSIAPGESKYGEILVENSTPQIRSMRLYLQDWYYLPAADGSKEFVPANTTPLSCVSWINFSPSELTLLPFSKQKVNYSVKAPPGANGGYYAVLFFESTFGKPGAEQQGLQAGMSIAIRIATLFYVEVGGTIKRTGVIDNLSFKKDISSNTSSIQLDFRNTGNVDITVGGTFHILDKEGIVQGRGEFNNVYTFAGNSGKLTALSKGPLPKGKYDLVFTFDLGKALEEEGLGRGPVITKEVGIEVKNNGEIIKLGELK